METEEVDPIRIYLDTAVWIPYIFHTMYSFRSKRNTYAIKLIETAAKSEGYRILLSPFLSTEISTHLREGFILQKLRADGFSFKELNQYKKDYFLTEVENEDIDSVIASIGELPNVRMLDTETLEKEKVDEILSIIAHYHFDFYDALHYETVRMHHASYFVTTDAHLLKSIGAYQKGTSPEIETIKPKNLYQKLR